MEEEKAAAKGGEPPEPVVLRMELHCAGCAKKVKKSIKHMPGVASIVADEAANTVVVAGTADAAALKARIEAKTKKSVVIVSSGGGGGGGGGAKKPAAESKPEKEASVAAAGGGGEKKKADKEVAGGGEKKGDKDVQHTEEKGKKQPHVEKKPNEETVLLRVNLHCDGCADRIRRRIFKIKGVKDVVLNSNVMDEVKVSGTMDVPAMLDYLREKLDRPVEAVAVAHGRKDGGAGGDEKKDKGGDGEKKKSAPSGGAGTGGDGDKKKDKGKSIEMAGPSMVAAAASMAPAPAMASTYHVSPYGHVAYPQAQPPPASYHQYYGGNADAAGYANPNAAGYHQYYYGGNADGAGHANLPPNGAAGYYQHYGGNADGAGHGNLPHNAAAYYHPDADDVPNHQPYPPYPYHLDLSPAPQMFSDENPNACSLM